MWTCPKCSNQNWESSKVCATCKDPISPETERKVFAKTQREIKNYKPQESPPPLPPTDPQASLNCDRIREIFEGREAFYFEKGVLRVRVFNIRYDLCTRQIDLEVEEIPTKGLEHSLLHNQVGPPSPIRWNIGTGYLSEFSEQFLAVGYGGWELYFAPGVVRELKSVAANWPDNLDALERYQNAREMLRKICSKYCQVDQIGRVFPEESSGPFSRVRA